MKARDIIAMLAELDPDTEVRTSWCSHCEGENSGKVAVAPDEYGPKGAYLIYGKYPR